MGQHENDNEVPDNILELAVEVTPAEGVLDELLERRVAQRLEQRHF